MTSPQHSGGGAGRLTRWGARVLGLLTVGLFLFIIINVVINEDQPKATALPTIFLLLLTIPAAIIAWRWERIGGTVLIFCSLALGISILASNAALGLGPGVLLVGLMIYGVPPLTTGLAFLLSGQIRSAPAS